MGQKYLLSHLAMDASVCIIFPTELAVMLGTEWALLLCWWTTSRLVGIPHLSHGTNPYCFLQVGKGLTKSTDPLLNHPSHLSFPLIVAKRYALILDSHSPGPAFNGCSLNLHSHSLTDSTELPGFWQQSVPYSERCELVLWYVCFFCFFLSHPNSCVF